MSLEDNIKATAKNIGWNYRRSSAKNGREKNLAEAEIQQGI